MEDDDDDVLASEWEHFQILLAKSVKKSVKEMRESVGVCSKNLHLVGKFGSAMIGI